MEFLGDLGDNEMRYGMPLVIEVIGKWLLDVLMAFFVSHIPYAKHLHNKEWAQYDKEE